MSPVAAGHVGTPHSTARRDLVLTVAVILVCLILAHFLDVFEVWHEFAEANEDFELDEIPVAMAVAAIGFGWFALRRWRESRTHADDLAAINNALHDEIALRQETERELTAARVHAEAVASGAQEANEAKSRFLATISHEIRTPLNGVLGMAGLLLDSKLEDDARAQAQAIHSSGEALLDLINDILDLAKVEAGKISLEPMDFGLPDMIDGVVELMAPRAYKKSIELSACIDADVPILLHGDQGRVRQILLNLVGNAIKFTQTGGVALTAALERSVDDRSWITFEIADTGIGVPAEAQDALFEKFKQADNSTARRFGGTGLGLAICRELVKLMDGKIGFDSVEGRGSASGSPSRCETSMGPIGRICLTLPQS